MLLGALAAPAFGQAETARDLLTGQLRGLRVYSVSAGVGGFFLRPAYGAPAAAVPFQNDFMVTGALTVGWMHSSPKWTLTALYSGSYGSLVRHSELSQGSHDGSFTADYRVSQHWTIDLSSAVTVGSFNRLLFPPSGTSTLGQPLMNFEQLSAAYLRGDLDQAALASLLTGAPLLAAPADLLVYGSRMLSGRADTYVTYRPAPRLSLRFGAGLSQMRSRYADSQSSAAPFRGAIPKLTAETYTANISYSRSPRTSVGVTANAGKLQGTVPSTSYQVSAFATRRMGIHWISSVQGGLGLSRPHYTVRIPSPSPRPIGSGSLAYQGRAQSVTASAYTSVWDQYGVGATSSYGTALTWSWARPGSGWSTFASVGQMRTLHSGHTGVKALQVNAGVGRQLRRDITLMAQYAYLQNSGQFTLLRNASANGALLSIVWTPTHAH